MTTSTVPQTYRRYQIPTRPMPELEPVPPRFRVRVKRHRLIALVRRWARGQELPGSGGGKDGALGARA